MYWESMETDIDAFTKAYQTCQKFKKKRKKYRKLPSKQVELSSWECVCMDLVCTHTITDKTRCGRVFNAMVFIDLATG